jgi:hypothetical protein
LTEIDLSLVRRLLDAAARPPVFLTDDPAVALLQKHTCAHELHHADMN